MNSTLGNIILALGLIFSGFFIGSGIVKFKKLDQAIEVRGLAERTVKSDEASLRLTFVEGSNDLKDLNSRMTKSFAVLNEYLLAQGFSASEITKEPVAIVDKETLTYNNGVSGLRYSARGTFNILSKQVDRVVEVVSSTEALLEKGITISETSAAYYYTKLNSVKPDMLEEATVNAKTAAESFAKTAGEKLGGIKSATQGLFSIDSPYQDQEASSSVMKKIRVVTVVKFEVK